MTNLTVGALRAQLAKLPDDMLVVGPAFDHSYRSLDASEAKAEQVGRNELVEYYDEANATDLSNPIVSVLVLS